MQNIRITDSTGFISLSKDATGRNRRPARKLLQRLDIAGSHVVKFEMVHNDVELRCLWLCKVDGQDEPVQVWMDNGFKAIKKHTDTVPATEGGE